MTGVLPIVLMAFFCALFTGVYIWMRREQFGEAKRDRKKSGH
jgi:uncharacterized iron-regulated membrane protein